MVKLQVSHINPGYKFLFDSQQKDCSKKLKPSEKFFSVQLNFVGLST
jgi:hypothetical protein